ENPFDEELQAITAPFGTLLRDIVTTIDRHGLRRQYCIRSAEPFLIARVEDAGHRRVIWYNQGCPGRAGSAGLGRSVAEGVTWWSSGRRFQWLCGRGTNSLSRAAGSFASPTTTSRSTRTTRPRSGCSRRPMPPA